MSRQARRDTAPEIALRQRLHAGGYRFRVVWPVPGRARRTIDIAFPRLRVAVFVDGCFWHGCPEHGTSPHTNAEWWQAKLTANRVRDQDTTEHLRAQGWTVIRIWEHTSVRDGASLVESAVKAAQAKRTDRRAD